MIWLCGILSDSAGANSAIDSRTISILWTVPCPFYWTISPLSDRSNFTPFAIFRCPSNICGNYKRRFPGCGAGKIRGGRGAGRLEGGVDFIILWAPRRVNNLQSMPSCCCCDVRIICMKMKLVSS